jgi:hypothetical protein
MDTDAKVIKLSERITGFFASLIAYTLFGALIVFSLGLFVGALRYLVGAFR